MVLIFNKFLTSYAVIPIKSYATCRLQNSLYNNEDNYSVLYEQAKVYTYLCT